MEKINDIKTFEDWQTVRCHGEFEVTAHKLIIWENNSSITIILADDAGKKGSKLTKYALMWDYCNQHGSDVRNYLTDTYGDYSIETLVNALKALKFDNRDQSQLGTFLIYRYTVKGHTFRPSWWKPSGKPQTLTIDCGDCTAIVTTNTCIAIARKGDSSPLGLAQFFKLGDTCEQGSYNMTYTGEIIDIKAKYIEVNGCPCGTTRMTIEQFVWRNHDFNIEEICARNASWSD